MKNQKIGNSLLALMLCSSVFADIQEKKTSEMQTSCLCREMAIKHSNRGEPLYDSCLTALTIPARIHHGSWPYNVSFDVSFIYWYASQEGMSLASSASLQSGSTINLENGAVQLSQPFAYDPGFKVGIGMGYDEWEFQAKYTWIRQNTAINSPAPINNTTGGTSVWFMNNWFAQRIGSNNNAITATHVSSQWHVSIDWLDTTLSRPYYQSQNIILSPYGGIRAGWIRQSLNIGVTVPSAALTSAQLPLSAQPIYSHNHANSWGLGPVFGSGARWLIGSGVRLEGHGDFSLLFTQYTSLRHSENSARANTNPLIFSTKQTNYNTVRPMAELGLGLGWGTPTYCGKYHIDISADYDFNVLWDQNMLRSLADNFSSGNASSGDLFLHGLTLTGRFDF